MKKQSVSTREKLNHETLWFSAQGFIRLEEVSGQHFQNIQEYWQQERKQLLSNLHQPLSVKAARRLAKVKFYDALLTREAIRRQLDNV